MKLKLSCLLILVLSLLPAMLLAQNKPQAETKETAVYISAMEGNVFFQNFEKADLHMVVKPGDELNTAKGMVEVDLGKGNLVRLGQHTRVVFTDLQKESATLSVWEGSVYLQLRDQSVKVRSPQEEYSFEKAGLYRMDVEKDKTQVYKDPRVVDRFDSWSQKREEETSYQEYEPRYEGYGGGYPYSPYGGWMGWTWSPWWPGSGLNWYMSWYPFWQRYSPFMWSSYFWPTSYFGWNPYWYWNSWYYDPYPFYYGYGYGYGYYGNYGYGYRSRFGGRVVRRDQLQQPRGIVRSPDRVIRSTTSTLASRGKFYPSRIAPSTRTPSSSSRARIYSGPSGSYFPRYTAPRSYSSPSIRSFSCPSISRSFSAPPSGRSSGGARRR